MTFMSQSSSYHNNNVDTACPLLFWPKGGTQLLSGLKSKYVEILWNDIAMTFMKLDCQGTAYIW